MIEHIMNQSDERYPYFDRFFRMSKKEKAGVLSIYFFDDEVERMSEQEMMDRIEELSLSEMNSIIRLD